MISCQPFPMGGASQPLVFDAERIITAAEKAEPGFLKRERLEGFFYRDEDGQFKCVATSLAVRRAAGEAWSKMSETAKCEFLYAQLVNAISYTAECVKALTAHGGAQGILLGAEWSKLLRLVAPKPAPGAS
jgi:hypothetical protein